jgi:hypothetical protein
MANKADAWLARAKALLFKQQRGAELIQFAASFLTWTYGPRSVQLSTLQTALGQIAKLASNPNYLEHQQMSYAQGAVENAVAEIEGGLIGSLRAVVAGEIFAELVSLGKQILEDDTEAAKNVSAVLIAAALKT